jgi:hypothetical protein
MGTKIHPWSTNFNVFPKNCNLLFIDLPGFIVTMELFTKETCNPYALLKSKKSFMEERTREVPKIFSQSGFMD